MHAISYFPPYNSAAVGFNGALHNDFKTIDKPLCSLQNYGGCQIILAWWLSLCGGFLQAFGSGLSVQEQTGVWL